MRNAPIDQYEATPREVVAMGTDYPDGYLLARHRHRRAQLLYGASGVMQVRTVDGSWVVPPQRAVWIPPQVEHEVRMLGVSTRSVYIEPGVLAAMPARCQVLAVSPLLRQLLMAAVDMPAEYDLEGRDGALASLLLHELAAAEPLPLHVPLPTEARWLALCEAFLDRPDIRMAAMDWAARLHISLRGFNRLFRRHTGLSFGAWKQRACVVQALARLAGGETVTAIALDCGYESPAAFSTMFRRVLGQPPSAFQAGALRSPGGP
ncbi:MULTISPECIES: AraC family transcriptional regulator [Pseudomonas aeruginosa group]|uniref:AraC family transcriptional regulator n=1 Tax=Pseudomonas aeruginosa group TaxID=136841 RepID=UPI000869805D|nr:MULTISPECIES: helix-turn-helix transcriptional regulator [Pseudomonas aeruginosa group]AVR69335.1 AraC family transcriptional regulator [Pseudomonas paraeruginosa]MBG3907479.1 helix-turn-helix transcriptional regulator [Pseudomonas aeruginosa]MBG4204409.1 helix-turn-helix transcriptional regulator [Pseudomonas aeruginosa]MBG4282916.1 helix-turn-helix transcriptional regulator [Pseudomonas aeruginosa]MBG6892059.1 helix-turn-helix transcriptional regulator [Pseudomonas aeruginosa]